MKECKRKTQNHIKSVRPLLRFQIDLVQLSSLVASKNYKVLFIIVDCFSKYGYKRLIIDKKSSIDDKSTEELISNS